jgi:hypothetical protein
VGLKTEMAPMFAQVVEARDRYGLHAYLTAVENADLLGKLEGEIQGSSSITQEEKDRLQNVLRSGALPGSDAAATENVSKNAVALP